MQISKSSNFDGTRMKDQFLLLGKKINCEDNYILFCKKAFSNPFEGVTSRTFSGGKPPDALVKLEYKYKQYTI